MSTAGSLQLGYRAERGSVGQMEQKTLAAKEPFLAAVDLPDLAEHPEDEIVRLLNCSPGTPGLPHACTDGIPHVGPITVAVLLPRRPRRCFRARLVRWSTSATRGPNGSGARFRRFTSTRLSQSKRIDKLSDHLNESVAIDGFGKVLIAAGGPASLAVANHRIGRQGNDRL